MAVSLRSFDPIEPRFLLTHAWGEWVMLILFCSLFIAVAGAVLPRSLTERNTGKALTTILGIILGIGLFQTRNLYHFSFESFGFLAIWIVVIIAILVTFGLTKLGMSKPIAIALTYCLVFLTFVLPKPSMFDSFARSIPILNLLFYISFMIMGGKLFISMFSGHNWNAGDSVRGLKRFNLDERGFAGQINQERPQIDKEINEDKKEDKAIQYKTFEVTRKELKTIDDIYLHLKEISNTIEKKGNNLQESDKAGILSHLGKIQKDEYILLGGLIAIRNHAKAYKLKHRKDITEIEDRLKKTINKKQRKILTDELLYQNKMLEALDYLEKYETRVFMFKKTFDKLLYMSIERLKSHNTGEALAYLKHAQMEISKIRYIYEKQMSLEHYLVKLNKKTIESLKSEKKAIKN